jgi:hypothetical protein
MYLCVCVCVTGILNQGLHLLGKCSTTWATPPALFALVIFQVKSCDSPLPFMALDHDPPTYASHCWDYRGTLPCLACWLRWELSNFLPGLALNCNPSDLCLQSNWDYRHVSPLLSPIMYLLL